MSSSSRGICLEGGLYGGSASGHPGDLPMGQGGLGSLPREPEKQAVCILLECFLVVK